MKGAGFISLEVLWTIFYTFLYGVYIITIIWVALTVVLENRKPIKTTAWLLVIILLPLVGLLFYYFFGQNIRKEKLFNKKRLSDNQQVTRLVQRHAVDLSNTTILSSLKVADKLPIVRLLANRSKTLLTQNNKVSILKNGPETFQAIFDAIAKAEKHIHLEYYIFEEGQLADKFKEILIRKAKEGVKVRIIYDDVGSWHLSRAYINQLKKANIQIESFLPVSFPRFTSKINYRNHRKIVIVDGKTGFLGGINVSDKYIKGDPKLGLWRDTHLKLEGAAVGSLQLIFLTEWYFLTDDYTLDEQECFPDNTIVEEQLVQIVSSGPDSNRAYIMEAFFASIATAKQRVNICTPYFMPVSSILTALRTAALSGVEVNIILPGKSDSKVVQYATHSYISQLLKAGINVYFYQAGFVHAKVLTVDDIFVSIGTANMDYRSFEYNLEVNAVMYNEALCRKANQQFQEDIDDSQKVFLDQWKKRPLLEKVKESFARLFAPLF